MEEVVKRYILESFREEYHRAGKLAKGEQATTGATQDGAEPDALVIGLAD